MTTKLYVGNMNYKVHDDDLGNLFAQFGNVLDVKIITDRDTNRSKGFAFIEMENKKEADEAVLSLNNTLWMDRQIKVNIANERPSNNRSYRN